jgi:hypothetical protein
MTNHVEISGGAFHLIGAANRLQLRGETLQAKLAEAMSAVETAENDPGTFPRDEFTNDFLANYHQVPEGGTLPANEAVRQQAVGSSDDGGGLGEVLSQLGQLVSNAMWSYSDTDDAGGRNISGT